MRQTVTDEAAFQFTLPRGERLKISLLFAISRCFNSRSRGGSDLTRADVVTWHLAFQFTLPRGERRKAVAEHDREAMFQFTLPRGERPLSKM